MDAAQASHLFGWIVVTITIVGALGATAAMISMAKSPYDNDSTH